MQSGVVWMETVVKHVKSPWSRPETVDVNRGRWGVFCGCLRLGECGT